ncbi:phage repressor [Acidovorax sp. KKS102]|uniref:S24 family peptidase n=1 Tax=Acidovorax sp. KKS102 TaxID=358220 RepID=UPI00028B6462|nr:S24 family peptidase [Acidovorax sp. KKS102]AFU45441.1 phage repressor [Acidovorax sp. KKS102]
MKDIDAIRRDNMRLIEKEAGGTTEAATLCGMSPSQFINLRDGAKDSKTGKQRGMRKETARRIEESAKKPAGWLDVDHTSENDGTPPAAPAPYESPSESPGMPPDLVITQFASGGGMDSTGRLLLDDQPGIIRSWKVSHEWLRLNVPHHTGVRNLCIVTGFGPSMRPMFNPGDPLLVDTGVKVINHEGVYFFRVGDEGFIKIIQRVPEFDGPGFALRIISKNPDYPPYDISPKNPHFEVLGKVLTVWRSEQY